MKRSKNVVCSFFILAYFISCVNSSGHKNNESVNKVTLPEIRTKPPSSYQDTLTIRTRAAVFYYPDSLQLEKIKRVTEKNIFESSMHEYFYQFRNAHNVLKQHWPYIKIIEAKNIRYLQFIKKDRHREIIDLNMKNDAFGLFVFDGVQQPVLVDLTNIESELGFYFSPAVPRRS